jgi:tRNA threonylcarbamoyladenosine biosynthesis protein TsaB
MAYLLIIDTSTELATVCISKDSKVLAYEQNSSQRDHAAFVQPAIQKLIDRTKIKLKTIDCVAVAGGPGSYTGIRVGMASAKGLCYALDVPFIIMNTLEIMALSAIMEFPNETLYCPMIDARRMEVFAAVYDNSLNEVITTKSVILHKDSFKDIEPEKRMLFTGSGSKKSELLLERGNAGFDQVEIKAEALAKIAERKYSQSDFSDIHLSEPLYIKDFHTI